MTAARFLCADQSGCAWYRCLLPALALQRAGLDVDLGMHALVRYARVPRGADPVVASVVGLPPVVVIQRPLRDTMRQVVERAVAQGTRVIIELDDDFWALPAHHPARAIVGTWAAPNLTRACQLAAAVIVSTPHLARRVARVTGQRNVVVIPNAVDPALFAPCPLPPDGAVRVGWAGGWTHAQDFALVAPALDRLARRPDVDLYIFGNDHLAATPIPHEHIDWCDDIPEHYRRIGVLDVAFAPLVDDRFNRSKSAVKWLEHATHGTPMVLSPVAPYAEAARDGATALFADSPRDWHRQLARLCDDPILRRDIGEAARATVLAEHTIDRRVGRYREVLGL